MEEFKNKIKDYILKNGNKHVLIHSDVLFGFKIKYENQAQFLDQHLKELEYICQPLDIIMPAFNYDFCKGSTYNMNDTPSQVGILTEHFRKTMSDWRTYTPVFNFSGTGINHFTAINENIDPFDKTSVFNFLNKNQGILMHYGSGFHTTTLIHYIERISGKLIYRFYKTFQGIVIDDKNNKHKTNLIYHVRPLQLPLNYDWVKLEEDLINKNILQKFKNGRTQISLARINEIVDYWLYKLDTDPFYLIDNETKIWVEKKYNELKRPFIISDFE